MQNYVIWRSLLSSMKSLELTEAHKSKLLEMCEKLFPESNWAMSTQNGTCGMHAPKESQEFVYEGTNPYNFPISIIHWFEFCLTYLMYRLSYEFCKPKQNISSDRPIHIELWELNKGDYFKKHPVDYLYEEFLKLKTT